MSQSHKSHRGELVLQERRNTPKELIDAIPGYIRRDMPVQHADFFADLPYLPLATLDRDGRPWVSILVTASSTDPNVGINVRGGNVTDIIAETTPNDPFARALGHRPASAGEKRFFAGVGVDFNNRRRNKIAGTIEAANVDEKGKVELRLRSDQHLGNCPKYITVRALEYMKRAGELVHDSFDTATSILPADVKAVVGRASTVFLATKHVAGDTTLGAQTDMGVNHRGGAPGFTRVYEENDGDQITTYLVLPDHSGNRFYQSLGNIETDPQVGLMFPDFTTGDVLYITGEAKNLTGQDAEALMPRVELLTRIKVTGAVFVKHGLNLRLTSEEQLSPYNPPVKYLRHELDQMGQTAVDVGTTATLISTKTLSDSITTFNFQLSSPTDLPLPGGFGIFDFSRILDLGYNHMYEANPQLVNEDYVRTWTLSSASDFDAQYSLFRASDQVSVTVKRKKSGLISNLLHDNADTLIAQNLPVTFKGTGAGFSCFSHSDESAQPHLPAQMLWIAGGAGITPFMAMWDGILKMAKAHPSKVKTDIVLMFAGRDDDVNVLAEFAAQQSELAPNVTLRIHAFQSSQNASSVPQLTQKNTPAVPVKQRRMEFGDIQSVSDLMAREIFLCGPDALMNWSETSLTDLGIAQTRIHRESFVF